MKSILRFLLTLIILAGAINVHAGEKITIMCYNVHNGVGLDGKRDHKRIGGVIKAFKPDFVGIQEVDSVTNRAKGTYVLGDIADAAGLNPIFAPAIEYDGGVYGIGLLTTALPDSVSRIPLPGRDEKRALVVAYFKDFIIANSHFSLTPEDALESVNTIKTVIDNAGNRPVVFMGDLNSAPDSPVIDSLSRFFKIVSPDAPTFPADHPDKRIDYIMVSNGTTFTVETAEVAEENVASDHRPVIVTLTFTE